MFRHYCVILRQLVINTLPSYVVFQMQLLVIQFIIKIFHIGFMQVLNDYGMRTYINPMRNILIIN